MKNTKSIRPIPHDATMIVSTMIDAGGECDKNELERQVSSRLTHCFVHAWDYLIDAGIIRQLHVAAGSTIKVELTLPKNHSFNKTASQHCVAAKRHLAVHEIVSQATDPRNFHAGYQAVVAGKVSQRDPVMVMAERMSPIDRPDFLNAFLELDPAEQKNYRRRIARSAARGG